ncbi:MAG: hypothetical protein K6U04_01735 [Armatimonadetes bacterium]|nr:hypothetical protein [Armatimonadota bacterium]
MLTVVEKPFPEEGWRTGPLFRPNLFLDFSREGGITGRTPGFGVSVWPWFKRKQQHWRLIEKISGGSKKQPFNPTQLPEVIKFSDLSEHFNC